MCGLASSQLESRMHPCTLGGPPSRLCVRVSVCPCMRLAGSVDECRRALVEKADMAKVEARIDRKYQDVVAYLNEAIKVAGDDEVRMWSFCWSTPVLFSGAVWVQRFHAPSCPSPGVPQAEFKSVSAQLQKTVKELMDTKADRR
jgi:hypothetical protein